MPEAEAGSLFAAAARARILERLSTLNAGSSRRWGKMEVGQMLAHCTLALELPMDDPARKQHWLGKIFAPFVRRKYLSDAPFSKNSPTDPAFVVTDSRELAAERARLLRAIARFVERGPEPAGRSTHSFFGRMTGAEWGRLMYKHLDHHLQQFGA